jgi:hypothetical protein
MAAAIAANPDKPVPAAAMAVHPDPPPESGATAMKEKEVTVGAAWVVLFAGPNSGAFPVEDDAGPARAAEAALGPGETVTVLVTVTGAPGVAGAPGASRVDVTDRCGNCDVGDPGAPASDCSGCSVVTVGENAGCGDAADSEASAAGCGCARGGVAR